MEWVSQVHLEWFEDPQWNGGWVAKWDKGIDKGIDRALTGALTGVWKKGGALSQNYHRNTDTIRTQQTMPTTPGKQGELSTQGLKNTLELFGQHSLMAELGGSQAQQLPQREAATIP